MKNLISLDFNAELPDGRFGVRLERLGGHLRLGGGVTATDEDGNTMRLVLDEIDDRRAVAYLMPDWPSWRDGGSGAASGIRLADSGAGQNVVVGNFVACDWPIDQPSPVSRSLCLPA